MTGSNRSALLIFLIICSFIGFMVKLPLPFRGIGFELHAAFYFLASIFLFILFPKKHVLILFGLIFFGIMIEVMQHASNYVLEKRIHGNFDPLDVKYNLMGIFLVFVPFYGLKILGKMFK
jgi:hypothetical protein